MVHVTRKQGWSTPIPPNDGHGFHRRRGTSRMREYDSVVTARNSCTSRAFFNFWQLVCVRFVSVDWGRWRRAHTLASSSSKGVPVLLLLQNLVYYKNILNTSAVGSITVRIDGRLFKLRDTRAYRLYRFIIL